MNTELEQLFSFILELDKEKFITRQTYKSDGKTKENDAEHAWHMAVMAFLLADYANEPIDVLRTIKMILLHDVVEIDAGDTYAYDEAGIATQSAREEAAAKRIFSMLPERIGSELIALWHEFEARETPESKFAHTMDNIQPIMLNAATNGRAWEEHSVQKRQIMKRNAHTADGSRELWEYAEHEFVKPYIGNKIKDE